MLVPRPSKPAALRVVIVDDQAFNLDLMTRLLATRRSRYEVVAAVGSASEAIAACSQFKPEVLVLDINLPDQNGIDALPAIRRVAPDTGVLLCTGYSIDGSIADIAQSGADGFIEKTRWEDLLHAVECVGRGEHYFRSSRAHTVMNPRAFQRTEVTSLPVKLTKREREVLTLIGQGLTGKEIASKLGISVATVETHRSNLKAKLQVRSAAGLISAAFKIGLVKSSPRAH